MCYRVCFNKDKIRKITAPKIERSKVHTYINMDDELLAEKDNWYIIDKKIVSFFKARDDYRLATECLSEQIFKSMGMISAHYEIVYLNQELGLLTPNFQNIAEYDYYDLVNICTLFKELNTNYNKLTFKALLEMISYQNIDYKDKIMQELIDRYVGEWATHQTDGNQRNLMLMRSKRDKRLKVAPSFDREKCFGVDKNGCFSLEETKKIWIPAIPYSDLNFRNNPYTYDDGIDINILELYMDYPKETEKAFVRIFSVNYKEIFDRYRHNVMQFTLEDSTIDYLCDIIDSKDKQKQKILSLKG